MNLTCIIVDDEPNAVKLLEVLVQEHTAWKCQALCYNAAEALAFLKANPVDFIFLDINMPKLTGMELAGLLPANTRIVFTTAYSEYALDSFNFQTIDYLLKPITLKRFLVAVGKIENYFTAEHKINTEQRVFFKSGKVLKNVRLSEILYFEGEQEYIRVVTPAEQFLIYRRLKELQEQLPAGFVRVHNSYIVNAEHIDQIKDNHVHIGDKAISVSEKFREELMRLVGQRLF
ncbi:LytTR family DNA-binding domain-containing protein [Mucilaginibacter sabulilitoris]|uniref:LytTR family DNA-binding domain-containing protein n=1 Tax=Mucilaginibacter sabulilitoris TaxID=1173583 RepID=A0ABZ0TI66_9SPHI|nr:LytTR family DNA-binding domain-containing protein [Mucilaginibacter sabulilitoris]WPU92852.1 LytTR family DNA-binding domain-containing protein [Mucilaginibacter sabulilitoris]